MPATSLNNRQFAVRRRAFKSEMLFARLFIALIVLGSTLLAWQFLGVSAGDSLPAVLVNQSLSEPEPVNIKIPIIKVNAAITNLYLNKDGTLQVPENPSDVGWYVNSSSPGNLGAAVLVGHKDSLKGREIFYDLDKLKAGDEFEIQRQDGSIAVFRVDSIETFSQDSFPTDKVYGPIDYAGIRLITCTGWYSILRGRYSDNLIVFGTLVRIIS